MRTASDIQSALANLRYYNNEIAKLSKQQFELDIERGKELGVNTSAGTVRFDSLGAIGTNCSWIETYCNSIEVNLKSAIGQDKLLHTEDEDGS